MAVARLTPTSRTATISWVGDRRWLLTATHPQRKKAHYHTAGTAPLYQGRFQSFPIQEDEHLFWVRRYVERNSWQGGLVPRAENWPWSSLGCRVQGGREVILEEGPRPLPGDWLALVNRPEREAELAALRRWVVRG
jgi:putative transposase